MVLSAGLLLAVGCQSVAVIQAAASDTTITEQASATVADFLAGWAAVALAGIALLGFFATIGTIFFTSRETRKRLRIEVEGYVRVDIGPPEGTADYRAPEEIAHIDGSGMITLRGETERVVTISVWYRNLQTHPLGIAIGIFSDISGEVTNTEGKVTKIDKRHTIAYLEPKTCVRFDVVRFPSEWKAKLEVKAIKYYNLYGLGETPRHGRQPCFYEDGEFFMQTWSDPANSLLDRAGNLWTWLWKPRPDPPSSLRDKARNLWAWLWTPKSE